MRVEEQDQEDLDRAITSIVIDLMLLGERWNNIDKQTTPRIILAPYRRRLKNLAGELYDATAYGNYSRKRMTRKRRKQTEA